MIRTLLALISAGLVSFIAYVLMTIVSDDVIWALVAAVVVAPFGFALGAWSKGDRSGHDTRSPS